MIDQMTYPVLAWVHASDRKTPMFVAHLPGEGGGVDWGYTNRAQGNEWMGRIYDKAIPLSKWQWQRFAASHRGHCAAFCCPYGPVD